MTYIYFKYHYSRSNDCMKVICWPFWKVNTQSEKTLPSLDSIPLLPKEGPGLEYLSENVICNVPTRSARGEDPAIFLEGVAFAVEVNTKTITIK